MRTPRLDMCTARWWRQFLSTPLIMAVQQDQVLAVEVLLARGADPNVQNFVRAAQLPPLLSRRTCRGLRLATHAYDTD